MHPTPLKSTLTGTLCNNEKSNCLKVFNVNKKIIFGDKPIPPQSMTNFRLQSISTNGDLVSTSINKSPATYFTTGNTLPVKTSGLDATKLTLKDWQPQENLIIDSNGSTMETNKIVSDKNDLIRLKIKAATAPLPQQQLPFPSVSCVPKLIDLNSKTETDGKSIAKTLTTKNLKNPNQNVIETMAISKPLINQSGQQYIKIATSSGVGQLSRQMCDAMLEFHNWQKENDSEKKMSKIDLNNKLNEIIRKHQFTAPKKNRVPSSAPGKRSTLSTRSRDHVMTSLSVKSQKRKTPPTTFDEEVYGNLKKSRNNSTNLSKSVPILGIMGEAEEIRRNKPAEHDALYNLLRSEAAEVLRKKNQPQQQSVPLSVATITTGISGSQNMSILNRQLTDVKAPNRMALDQSALLSKPMFAKASAQNNQKVQMEMVLSADRTGKSNTRKILESINVHENLLKIIAKQVDTKSIANEAIESIKSSPSRTISGRSKSLNSSSGRNTNKFHLKITEIVDSKSKSRMRKHLDQNWNSLTDVQPSSLQDDKAKALHTSNKSDTKRNGKTIFKTKSLVPMPSDSNESNIAELKLSSEHKFMDEIEQLLCWNTRKSAASLPTTSIAFERNEFGMIECAKDVEQNLNAPKVSQNDANYPQLQSLMACGHTDSITCFNAIIKRIDKSAESYTINRKKPNQYFSNEFRELIASMVQRNGNKCHAISFRKIVDAIMETDKFERTKSSNNFNWSRFIDFYNENVAPNGQQIVVASHEIFYNSFPNGPNMFEIGQKLEAIDPQNCGMFCVCIIVDKCGFRIKLRLDGYPSAYDFWVNADSENIFPIGWCSRTARKLGWPNQRIAKNGLRETTFDWNEYLQQTASVPAPRSCFRHLNEAMANTNLFKIGMKLEADDMKFTRKICVATIGDVINSQILITFDGFDDSSNYWTDTTSPYIHPVNWHNENGYSITTPPGWKSTPFKWNAYLRANRAKCVSNEAFCTRNPIPFTVGMALEVVDKKNSSLIRPATVTMVDEYEIKILYIGWPEAYAYWMEDNSRDIYPANWAKKTGHPIECPLDEIYNLLSNGCGIRGCRGLGNSKNLDASIHTTLEDCPYELSNWQQDDRIIRPNRIDRKHKTVNKSVNVSAASFKMRVSANPALEKPQVSLQLFFNPTELATMTNKDLKIYQRLQASANFLLDNKDDLSKIRAQWIERMHPSQSVKLLAAAKNPLHWSVQEVVKFVTQLPNCAMLGPAFIEHEIDGMAFLALRQHDMIDIMGLSLGSAIKIFNRIVYLREECNAHYIRY